MKKPLSKWLILLAIGSNCIFWGMTLKSFGIIGDGFAGFFIGLGLVLEISALIFAKTNRRCNLRPN